MAGRIEINPYVMLGKPVIRRTRITAERILCKLSEGATEATGSGWLRVRVLAGWGQSNVWGAQLVAGSGERGCLDASP